MVMTLCLAAGAAGARDRLPELWHAIEDAHYVYLETDDSPEKICQRKKLEDYMKEYLMLVPHECKFGLPETAKAFQRTILETDFSGYRAGLGWAALARYAENLLTQPWRKEYRTIRLYCGYYKHEVEANMVGAEGVLRAMGYRGAGGGARLQLSHPPCPDLLAAVARDALLAQIECRIMCEMWERAWSHGARVTWRELAAARAAPCSSPATDAEIYANVPTTSHQPQVNITGLNHRQNGIHPSNYICNAPPIEEPIVPMIHPNYVATTSVMPPNIVYNMHGDPVIAQCNPVPMMTAYSPYCYPVPVHNPYLVPAPMYVPVKHSTAVPMNGYSLSNCRHPPVPTAQLIELDIPSPSENGRSYRDEDRDHKKNRYLDVRRNSTSKSGYSEVSLPSLPRSDTQPAISKAQDGMGTYGSWDYVYRNLSSKHEERDNNSRVSSLERDSKTLDRLSRDERRSRYQPTSLDLEDGMQALNIDRSLDEDAYRTAKVNENLMRLKQEEALKKAKQLAKKAEEKRLSEERRRKGTAEYVGHPSAADALISTKVAPDKVRLLTKQDVKERKEVIKQQNSFNGSNTDLKRVVKVIKPTDVDVMSKSKPTTNGHGHVVTSSKLRNSAGSSTSQIPVGDYDMKTHLIVSLDEPDSARRSPTRPSNGDHQPTSGQPKDNPNKWECGTCTYFNVLSANVCEMCGKSKQVGSEIQPLMSGGRECPTCTLVNSREAKICDACGTGLQHCPTYI